MNYESIIHKKRDGKELSSAEIDFLVRGITDGSMPDYQISAWAMAVYFQGMNARETRDLAVAMANSGDKIDLSPVEGIKVDKHSTGGVGDKTTMIVIPLVAAAGVPAAKMSGRGLGHTGGTIDKFEAIPEFKVELTDKEFIQQVNRVKAAVISQTGNLVPADKKLYAIRDVTATVESIPLIASSIMSKKLAAGSDGIVLDVKVGRGAFMKDKERALQLAETMVEIGKGAGRQVTAVLSAMDQPLGHMVGNALEVKEAIDTLKGQGPQDLTHLSLILAAHMLVIANRYDSFTAAFNKAEELLHYGEALDKFIEMVEAQQGKLDFRRADYGLVLAKHKTEVLSANQGYITGLDAYAIGRAAMSLGAGRSKIGEKIDHSVGIEIVKKIGDKTVPGDVLAVIYSSLPEEGTAAAREVMAAYESDTQPVKAGPLIIHTVG